MKPKQELASRSDETIEVVIGIFPSHEAASRVAASLRGPDLKLQRVSRTDPAAPSDMPQIVYDEIEDVSTDELTKGALLGGAIGASSGLLLLGIPGLNIAAPVMGALAGAWIGAVAGVDESIRGIQLPNQDDYQKMLQEGKSFVVIAGDPSIRSEYGKKMAELGAEEIHQHPPIHQVVRNPG